MSQHNISNGELNSRDHPSTTALIDELDKRHIVVMRDGRNLVGSLRSFDQFGETNPLTQQPLNPWGVIPPNSLELSSPPHLVQPYRNMGPRPIWTEEDPS